MTLEATLTRGNTSIDLPLIDEGSGVPLVSRDFGKPSAGEASKGEIDPRWSDQNSGTQTITLNCRFKRENAYSKAIEIADLIKSSTAGEDTFIDIPLPEYDPNLLVAPSPQGALNITYQPGRKEWVDVQLSLTRVNEIQGAEQSYETPTATGNGPITLEGLGESVPLVNDIEVERDISRPNSNLSSTTFDLPNYIDHHKSAEDLFSLSCVFKDNAVSHAEAIDEMTSTRLGYGSLTLDFNGIYGLGSFPVVPRGSQAARLVRASAEKDIIRLESLDLRVVL